MVDDKKRFIIKKRFIFLLALIFFLIGGASVKFFSKLSNVVVAVNITDTLGIMGENNPINKAFSEEVRRIEEEKINAEIAARKLEEEKKIAEEKRIEEERIKAEEEAKKLAEEKAKNGKIAYLTFDDGPSKRVTPAILDVLDDYNIKATFFVIGKMGKANEKVLKRIFDEGHSIGNHTYSHKYGYIYKNTENFISDLKLADKVFKDILGEDFETNILRLPGGSFEKYKQKFLIAAAEEGYQNYDWNALNGDAEGVDLSKEKLINRLKSTTKKQKELIVLMHDTDAKKTTVEALPAIIEYLIKEGYEFRTIGQ